MKKKTHVLGQNDQKTALQYHWNPGRLTCSITEIDRFPLTILSLEAEICCRLYATAEIAEAFLAEQNPDLWSMPSGWGFLHQLRQGQAWLARLGRSPGKRTTTTEEGPENALELLQVLTRFGRLNPLQRKNVSASAELIAALLPCRTDVLNLPHWKKVKTNASACARTKTAYEQLRTRKQPEGKTRYFNMSEALDLFQGLSEEQRHSAVAQLRKELEKQTESFRSLIRQLAG